MLQCSIHSFIDSFYSDSFVHSSFYGLCCINLHNLKMFCTLPRVFSTLSGAGGTAAGKRSKGGNPNPQGWVTGPIGELDPTSATSEGADGHANAFQHCELISFTWDQVQVLLVLKCSGNPIGYIINYALDPFRLWEVPPNKLVPMEFCLTMTLAVRTRELVDRSCFCFGCCFSAWSLLKTVDDFEATAQSEKWTRRRKKEKVRVSSIK